MGEQTGTTKTEPVATVTEPDTEHADTATGPTSKIGHLRFDLLYSALYHDGRQIYWLRIHRLCLFVTILLGSGAIAAFGAEYPVLGQFSGIAVALLSAAQLVWDFGSRARDHNDLRRRFYILLGETEDDRCNIPDIRRRMTVVYADEPPINERARKRAHNQAGESLFGDDFDQV
ncbi:MAG: hypothetical protein BM560_20090 [Roseobacter sp. MedPE-SWde]|mgnify:CR=1 FL=1|nr:MAG: hypothetical protein BM560_20090 [Roseobacter sp. MedPE-SWde]